MAIEETYLITGGAGFIGSHFVDYALMRGHKVIVLDKFTYAGKLCNLKDAVKKGIKIVKGDISNTKSIKKILSQHKIQKVINFAAETHVDNSISGSDIFIKTNILGTYSLLKACLEYYQELDKKESFRYLQVSTDEVFGALGAGGKFSESSSYDPRSPYSSSKAAADHLVMAWVHTYKFPAIITHCSNNYGTRQHPEKLIPKTIQAILDNTSIPVYGKGNNVRDWIHVFDHCQGIYSALNNGKPGEHYLFGGANELSNLELIYKICDHADTILKRTISSRNLITFVEDRKGHDFRYAVDYKKAGIELFFIPSPISKLDTELQNLIWEAIE